MNWDWFPVFFVWILPVINSIGLAIWLYRDRAKMETEERKREER